LKKFRVQRKPKSTRKLANIGREHKRTWWLWRSRNQIWKFRKYLCSLFCARI